MKPFYQLHCDNQELISNKVIAFLKDKTGFLNEAHREYWNKGYTIEIVKTVPELPEYFSSIGLKLREIAVLVANKANHGIVLHVDEKPMIAKINFPILNTKNIYTSWYNIPNDVINSLPKTINQFGGEIPDLSSIDVNTYSRLAKIETTTPIVFNSSIPHQVEIGENAVYPRIVLSCMFFNEPIEYLL